MEARQEGVCWGRLTEGGAGYEAWEQYEQGGGRVGGGNHCVLFDCLMPSALHFSGGCVEVQPAGQSVG